MPANLPPFTVSPEDLLSSVVHITEQRSRENLEQSLVATLVELTDLDAASIVRPLTIGGDDMLECVARARRGGDGPAALGIEKLADRPLEAGALASGEPREFKFPDGSWRRVVPIGGGVDDPRALLVIEQTTPDVGHAALFHGFAAIYRNYLTILRDAERDTLTGLKNRKTFDGNIGRIIANARRVASGQPSDNRRQHPDREFHWMAICDIDHFKRVNDTFGHVFGDEVLLLFSALMRKTFRSEDLLFRFGGEEFVVVLAPTTLDLAGKVLERFRAVVENFTFPQVGRVTASVGYVRINADDIPTAVLGQADAALYYAKNHGRNRVCSYEALVASGELTVSHEEGSSELF